MTKAGTAVLTSQIAQMRAAEDVAFRRAAGSTLSNDEADLLLIALAPEVDLRYETLYAYANDIAKSGPPSIWLSNCSILTRKRGWPAPASSRQMALAAPQLAAPAP
ncbi:MAG: hypothetical protein H6661_02605 [Ardenticatenaceae bacterium]|nr:hypothetical protein [Ardenticatenaceae bacterium]